MLEKALYGGNRECGQMFMVNKIKYLVLNNIGEIKALKYKDTIGGHERPDPLGQGEKIINICKNVICGDNTGGPYSCFI